MCNRPTNCLGTPNSEPPLDDAELLDCGFRYAMALVHHREDAEDLAQEAWLNLNRRYGKVASKSVLFTAIKNLVIDRYRRSKVVSFETGEALDEEPGEEATAPGDAADVESLLGTLREGEREALFLHYFEGRTAEEIGRMTEQPRNTVLSLMRRGLQKLRTMVEPNPDSKPNPSPSTG